MKQKVKYDKNAMYELAGTIASLFVILMLGFFPLYFQDGYFNITNAKRMFFYFCGSGLVILAGIFAGIGYLQERKELQIIKDRAPQGSHKKVKEILGKIPVASWFVGGFLLSVLIATIFSMYPFESFYGTDGRKLDAIIFVLCIAAYMILGKFLQPGIWMAWIFLISGGLVSLLLVLQFWGINALHMWDGMVATEIGMFASTIGNVNACATYFCMALPAGMVLFYLSDKLFSEVLYGTLLVLGFFGAYATATDSWIMGVGTAFLIMFCFSLKNHDYMERFVGICMMFWVSSLAVRIILLVGAENTSVVMQRFRSLALQNFMTSKKILLTEGILLCFAMLFIKLAQKKKLEIPYKKIRIVFISFVVLFLGFAVAVAIVANLSPEKQWEGKLQWMNLLKLKDDFGSSRGIIWKQTWAAWKKLPVGRKFFGYGINCFHQFLYQYQGMELAPFGVRVIDPHNELLQFMSMTGIFGAVCYFGFLISTAVSAAKQSRHYPVMMMGTVVICSYLAQSMVNNPTVFLTPTLFLYLGILKSLERHYKEKEC